jgi:hypothetical protein
MRARLDLHLRGHSILGHPSDNPEKAIAGGLPVGIVPPLLSGKFSGQPCQIGSVNVSPPTGPNYCLHASGVGPPSNGVRAHAQKLCR